MQGAIPEHQHLGERIRRARLDAGLSQQALAEALRCSRTTVNRWEKGLDPPSDEKIHELARVLGLSDTRLVALKKAGRSAMRVQKARAALAEAAAGLVRERGARYGRARRKGKTAVDNVAKTLAAMSPEEFEATLDRALQMIRERNEERPGGVPENESNAGR